MDKRQFSTIITNVYKSLTPSKVSTFFKNEEMATIRVVSNAFKGMTFSARFKLLNDEFQKQEPDLFNERIYLFEAFTEEEAKSLAEDISPSSSDSDSDGYRESAKELE